VRSGRKSASRWAGCNAGLIGSLSLALICLFIIQHALGFGDLALGIVFVAVSISYWYARPYIVAALKRPGETTATIKR
jgi:hypothetical protein